LQTTPNIAKKVCISPLYPFRPYSISVSFVLICFLSFRPYSISVSFVLICFLSFRPYSISVSFVLICFLSFRPYYPFRSSFSVSFPSVLISYPFRSLSPPVPFFKSGFHPLSPLLAPLPSSPPPYHRRPLPDGGVPTRLPLPFCRAKTTARYLLLVATRRLAQKKVLVLRQFRW